jgi:hypothetical protein
LYRCGKCGSGVCSSLKEGRYQFYVCRWGSCTKIGQAPLDALVTEVVLQLAAEQLRLRGKLDGLARLHNADTIDDRQLSEGLRIFVSGWPQWSGRPPPWLPGAR